MRIFPTYTVDQEFTELGNLGFTGTLNDRQFKYLRSLQYTGTLTDMFFKYRFDPYTNYKLDGRLPSLLADFKNNVFATRPLDVNDYSLSGVAAALVTNFRDNAYLTGGLEQMTAYTRHGLITSGRSTTMIVRDEDGIYKHGAHNLVDTRLDDTGQWTQTGLTSVTSDGVGAKGKERFAVIENTATSTHYLQGTVSVTSGRTYTVAVDVKPIGSRLVQILCSTAGFGANVEWRFNPATQALTRVTAGTKDSARAVPLGDGGYRFEMTLDATATASAVVQIKVHNGSAASYTGDGASGLYLSRPIVYESSVGTRPELVTNGTFASDIAGWTDSSDAGGAISWNASGHMDLVYITGTVRARQDFAVVSGKRYRVTVERISGGVNSAFYVGSSSGAGDIVSQALNTAGVYVFDVTATASTFYIDVRLFSAGTATVDNISVIPIPDAMQPASDGEKWIPNETGAALYAAPVDYDVNGVRSMPVWEARTNSIRNSVFAGGTAGTLGGAGGVLPPNVSIFNFPASSTTVAFGSEGGLSYMELRFNGTPTAAVQINLEASTGIAASQNQMWANSCCVKISAGSTSNITSFALSNVERNSGGGLLSANDAAFSPTSNLARYSSSQNVDEATAAYVVPAVKLNWTSGAIDITLRFYAPQMEQGLGASPYIPTYGSTATRAADNLYTLAASFGYRQTEGTIVAEFESVGGDGADFPRIFSASDGGNNNQVNALLNSIGVCSISSVVSGSGVFTTIGSFTPNAPQTMAAGYKSGDNAGAINGGSVGSNTHAMPSGIVNLRYGMDPTPGNRLNGKLYSLAYYPFRAANSDLEAASA